ncbi:four helix bundle protein [Pseudomonas sp. S5(2021)]|nr:four helix bundle protein [Pseudomonas sp. S5(2021)]
MPALARARACSLHMSKSKNLPIYRASYELLSLVTELIRHFARDFRPSLGQRLHNEAVLLVLMIYRANAAEDKLPHIGKLLETLQVVEMLLQLSADLKLISLKQYARSAELTADIGRQAGGWQKFAASGNGSRKNHVSRLNASPAAGLPR